MSNLWKSSQHSADPNGRHESICKLVLSLAKALVDDLAGVRVTLSSATEEASTITLCVSPNDLGKVIGKQGRTARSLRTVLQAASQKQQHRFNLEIISAASTPQDDSMDLLAFPSMPSF